MHSSLLHIYLPYPLRAPPAVVVTVEVTVEVTELVTVDVAEDVTVLVTVAIGVVAAHGSKLIGHSAVLSSLLTTL